MATLPLAERLMHAKAAWNRGYDPMCPFSNFGACGTWASLALTIGSGAAWLVAVAAGMSGKPLGNALSQRAVPIVLTRTRLGEDWKRRLALVVVLGFCLLAQQNPRWRDSRAVRWASLLLAAAMLASLAWAGHGAAPHEGR